MALWQLEQILWQDFNPQLVEPSLLKLVKGACLVEANSKDYVTYLTNIFCDDEALCESIRHWGAEERQHGVALARWAKMADPGFDFEEALEKFRWVHPIATDAHTSIRGSKAQELVARCMVETGTATYYAALSDAAQEPVLKQICRNISLDEVHHYKLFLQNFEKYKDLEGLSKWARFKTVVSRTLEADDAELALAFACGNFPGEQIRYEDYPSYSAQFMALACQIYRQPHIQKASRLAMNAAGLPNKPWLAKSVETVVGGAIQWRRHSSKSPAKNSRLSLETPSQH